MTVTLTPSQLETFTNWDRDIVTSQGQTITVWTAHAGGCACVISHVMAIPGSAFTWMISPVSGDTIVAQGREQSITQAARTVSSRIGDYLAPILSRSGPGALVGSFPAAGPLVTSHK